MKLKFSSSSSSSKSVSPRAAAAALACIASTLVAGSASAHGDYAKHEGQQSLKSIYDAAKSLTLGLPGLGIVGDVLPSVPLINEKPAAWEGRAESSYTLFESGQVRPLALSSNGKLLFATNTPDGRLEIYRVTSTGLAHASSVPVGVEPVAVALRDNGEAWVVNHVSDSVSIVRCSGDGSNARVERTLLVGDEPRDVVFAGPGKSRAFVTTAHRGQNSVVDPQLTTPGVGRADVWVFDAADQGASLEGDPLTVLTFFTDTPRALAVSPDGSKVYAAGFHTGNRTATIFELYVPDGGEAFGGVSGPRTNHQGVPAPEVGILVRFDGEHWRDDTGRVWDDQMRFRLPDRDVFTIDANAAIPAPVTGPAGEFTGVGTVLFNMATNPVTGAVYVSNLEANNMARFEGPGTFAGHSLRGKLTESRITVLKNGAVSPRHLNKHIDYDAPPATTPNATSAKSLAFPLDMQVTRDGKTLFVAGHGSSKIGVYSTAELEADTFVPSTASQIQVSGGGPSGLALDEARGRLYVLTRFDNSIAIVNTAQKKQVAKVAMYNPEPTRVVKGRPLLYDASFTSSHGDSACASCHMFGDMDDLAWDLGNPDADVEMNPNQMRSLVLGIETPIPAPYPHLHPMKGPMTTQSLRGMDNHGPMHWRADRTGAHDEPNAQPSSGQFDEDAAFKKFNGAFPDLLGRSEMISDEDMQAFTDFVLELTYPPNPIRALDNSLTAEQARGRDVYFNFISTGANACETCHELDPQANGGESRRPGFFGTSGEVAFSFETQTFKVPHLRNLYQKVGRFGQAPHPLLINEDHQDMGDQIRGFGYTHDGAFDTLFRFDGLIFLQYPEGDKSRREVESFFMAYDSNLAPVVGQQVTLGPDFDEATEARIDLLVERAEAGECDLVARSLRGGRSAGFVYAGDGVFATDRASQAPVGDEALRASVVDDRSSITYTCVPAGAGLRTGLDRDLDGAYDGDEADARTSPTDPNDKP